MAWDENKEIFDLIQPSDWNDMVSDQKEHAARHGEGSQDEIKVEDLGSAGSQGFIPVAQGDGTLSMQEISGGVEVLDSDPSSPEEGQTWINDTEDVLKWYKNSSTQVLESVKATLNNGLLEINGPSLSSAVDLQGTKTSSTTVEDYDPVPSTPDWQAVVLNGQATPDPDTDLSVSNGNLFIDPPSVGFYGYYDTTSSPAKNNVIETTAIVPDNGKEGFALAVVDSSGSILETALVGAFNDVFQVQSYGGNSNSTTLNVSGELKITLDRTLDSEVKATLEEVATGNTQTVSVSRGSDPGGDQHLALVAGANATPVPTYELTESTSLSQVTINQITTNRIDYDFSQIVTNVGSFAGNSYTNIVDVQMGNGLDTVVPDPVNSPDIYELRVDEGDIATGDTYNLDAQSQLNFPDTSEGNVFMQGVLKTTPFKWVDWSEESASDWYIYTEDGSFYFGVEVDGEAVLRKQAGTGTNFVLDNKSVFDWSQNNVFIQEFKPNFTSANNNNFAWAFFGQGETTSWQPEVQLRYDGANSRFLLETSVETQVLNGIGAADLDGQYNKIRVTWGGDTVNVEVLDSAGNTLGSVGAQIDPNNKDLNNDAQLGLYASETEMFWRDAESTETVLNPQSKIDDKVLNEDYLKNSETHQLKRGSKTVSTDASGNATIDLAAEFFYNSLVSADIVDASATTAGKSYDYYLDITNENIEILNAPASDSLELEIQVWYD